MQTDLLALAFYVNLTINPLIIAELLKVKRKLKHEESSAGCNFYHT